MMQVKQLNSNDVLGISGQTDSGGGYDERRRPLAVPRWLAIIFAAGAVVAFEVNPLRGRQRCRWKPKRLPAIHEQGVTYIL